MRKRTGWTYQRIAGRRRGSPEVLPHSTVNDMCSGKVVPHEDTLHAFLVMCGVPDSDRTRWQEARRRIVERPAFPPIGGPVHVVPPTRSEDIPGPGLADELLATLTSMQAGLVAMTTALAGAGGFGKTTMARMVVHDPRIRAHFPDGILWIPLGESVQGAELADRIDNLCAGITGIKPPFTEPLAAGAALGARAW